MSAPEDVSSITQLQVGVDAVLMPRGFAAGHSGFDGKQGQITWCAAAADLAARFPTLPTSREPAEGWTTMCTDLVVDLAVTGGDWCLAGVGLEGYDLDQMLTDLELIDAAQRATALLGLPAHECLSPLMSLLATLFERTTRQD